jgi:3-hydroxybutyryl-CoA dehydrogenase
MAEIRSIAVIGAGAIGRGIAHASALGGYRTILEDILPGSLRTAAAEIQEYLAQATALGTVSKTEADAAFARLEFAATVEQAARAADLVIESVPEEMESKIEIFTLLDKICKPGTILASNTLLFSVTEIASVTYRAKQILGMRFVHPVYEMKQLEIVRAQETDEETFAACAAVAQRMGKQVVMVQDHLYSQ